MEFTIKNETVAALNGGGTPDFPKYTSQLMNLANQNGHGTRPNVVGQMSELFPQYEREAAEISLDGWRQWYLRQYPDRLDMAADRIMEQVENLKRAVALIDRDMVSRWAADLVLDKTYHGMYLQQAILSVLAEKLGLPLRTATPQEEAQGIDGLIGDTAYSVKPDSYRSKNMLPETIDVKMVYYKKGKNSWSIEVED